MLNERAIELTNRYFGLCFGDKNFEAHENLWNTYKEQKAKQLDPLFGEELTFEREVEFNKPRKYIIDEIWNTGLMGAIKQAFDKEWRDLMDSYPYTFFGFTDLENMDTEEKQEKLRATFLNKIISSNVLCDNKIIEDMEFVHPVTHKTFKLRQGERITRALKHFISDKELLNEVQTKYSQIVNTKKLKGTLCLSIHPLDYMTVSVNNSGWSSCFNSLNRGEYCASTLCLMSSPNTMVAYLKGKDNMDIYRAMEWNNKKWRALVTLGKDNESVHVGRNYPYDSTDLVEEVIKMVGELTGKDYVGIELKSNKLRLETPYNMYNDTLHDSYTVGMTDKWYNEHIDKNGEETKEYIDISLVGAICPKCGYAYEDNEFDIVCEDCYEGDRCEDCGRPMSNEEGTYIEGIQGYVCDCCLEDNYSYCEHCEEYVHCGDIHAVKVAFTKEQIERGIFGNRKSFEQYWCESCLDWEISEGEVVYDESQDAYMSKSLLGAEE